MDNPLMSLMKPIRPYIYQGSDITSPSKSNCTICTDIATQTNDLDFLDRMNLDITTKDCDSLNSSDQFGKISESPMLIHSSNSYNDSNKSNTKFSHNSENNTNEVRDSTSVSPGTTFSENSSFIVDFTNALRDWSEAIQSKHMKYQDDVKTVLIQKITQLESQLADALLQCQIERKRRSVGKEYSEIVATTSKHHSNESTGTTEQNKDIEKVGDNSLSSFAQQRIHSALYQAQYFAARASFLQDELESLVPWIIQLAHKALCHHKALSEAQILSQNLQMKLDSTQSNTARQIEEMAKYMADITDELQELRNNRSLNDRSSNNNRRVSRPSGSKH